MKFEKKQDNRGFSLVELIIVIAIMAILIGIVGTQVIPYLNRSREAKDLQVISSYGTAAVSAYSMYAEKVDGVTSLKVYAQTGSGADADAYKLFSDTIIELVGISDLGTFEWSSNKATGIDEIEITVDGDKMIAQAYKGGAEVLDPVVSIIGENVSGS